VPPSAPRPAAPAGRPLTALPVAVQTRSDLTGVRVTGVTHDSRAVCPGDLYVALPGEHTHGARHVSEAVDRGAVAVLTDPAGATAASTRSVPVLVTADPRARLGVVADWVYGQPSRQLTTFGVTGTNGKTTTTHLLDAGLRAAGHRTGLIGTVQTVIDDDVVPSVRTTPEATDLHALFAVMREHDVDAVAMEVSSHALTLGRVDGVRFDVAVFTNLSQDHLDFHRDMESYFAAKASLFTPERARRAVVNVDDRHGRRLLEVTPLPVTTFSPAGDRTADWWLTDLAVGADGSRFRVHGPVGDADVVVRLLGAVNAANALAALAALVAGGVPLPDAVTGVGALDRVPGRMERVDAGQPFLALVDYAHTPEAVRSLLAALRPLTAGRLFVVLGCGGDRDVGKRPLMAATAAAGADVAVLTSDNPRSEDPKAILADMLAGVGTLPSDGRADVVVEPDRRIAVSLAVARCAPGDTLVVAGKGHEQGQEFADRTVPFDDRVVLREALRAAGSAA
jgi:UDP-N-acetylmuramoyl-L-alanyl-D-glutamate--2,6-diaminopimelate ligase